MKKIKKENVYLGQMKTDTRGSVTFFNSFNLSRVKRFYEVKNSATEPIRAFHGHMVEEKFIYVVSGKILLCTVKLSNPIAPSKKNKVKRYILSSSNPQIVNLPASHANGFKSLEKNSRVIFFSTLTLSESLKDDYRYPFDYWGKEIWNT